jgi:hypothetical protein
MSEGEPPVPDPGPGHGSVPDPGPDSGPDGDADTGPGSWRENPIWRLYTVYGGGNRRYALLGTVATVVGRAFGLVPAFVIGLAVDAVVLAERPYALPLVLDALDHRGTGAHRVACQ